MIINRKITSWETPVSAEADRPQRTASEMKAIFDGNSEQLKGSVNGLIDDLAGSGGAQNIGAPGIEGLSGDTLWAQITAFFNKVFGIVKTDQPSNRFLNGQGQYTVPSVGAAANGLPISGSDNEFLLKNGEQDFATKWANAATVRSALNVKDGADKTETAISDAGTVAELTETDSVPVLTSGLKKAPISALWTAMFGELSGILKVAAGKVSQAEAGKDYQAAITASGILKGGGVGGVSEADAGVDYAPPAVDYAAALSTAWTGSAAPYTQSVTVTGLSAAAKIFVGLAGNASDAEYAAAAAAQLMCTAKAANQVTITARGEKPTITLPIIVRVVG